MLIEDSRGSIARLGGHGDGIGDVVRGRAGGGGTGVFEAVAGAADPAEGSAALDPGWQREIRYPALGRATLFQQAQSSASDPLGKLIGQTRSRLLAELGQPATTTQLTRTHSLSLGTVAHHLSALRGAGLITSIRDGQSVIWGAAGRAGRRGKLSDIMETGERPEAIADRVEIEALRGEFTDAVIMRG